jgi:DNA-binding transcriptional LysR family regulator
MYRMADIIAIETFVAAVRRGSFAAAARELGVSPAIVGRRIQALEDQQGTRLIERTTRTQRLTEAGQHYFAQAGDVLDAMAALDDLAEGTSGKLTGRIRLSAPTTLGIRRLPPVIAAFSVAHPEVIIEMSLADRRLDLVAEGFDLAVRIGDLAASSMIARRVGTYRFAVCAAPSWLEHHPAPKTLDDLKSARCILNLILTPRNRWPFVGPGGEAQTVEVSGGIEIDSGEAQRAAALGGGGLVYLPIDLVRDDLAAGRLVRVLSHWQTITLPIHVVHPSRRFVPRRVAALIDALAEGLKDR